MAEEILFRINLSGAESIKALKDSAKDFKKELEQATDPKDIDRLAKAVKAADQELKIVTKQVNDFVKAQTATKDFPNTIQGMRDKLSSLNKEWKNAEIGSEVFKKLEKDLKSTTDTLKAHEKSVGDNRRNVGNYGEALAGLGGPLGSSTKGVLGFNTALKANPILAIIGLIVAFISKLSENAKVADFFSRILGGLNKAIAFIIDGFVDLVTNVDKLGQALLHPIDSIKKLFTGMQEAAKEGYEAADALDAFTVASAEMDAAIRKNQSSIDALTKSLKDKTKSEKERIDIANQIADLEEKNADIQAQKAQETLRIEELKLKGLTQSADQQAKLIQLNSDLQEAQDAKKEISAQRQTRINILLEKQETELAKTRTANSDALVETIQRNNDKIFELSKQLIEKQVQIELDKRQLDLKGIEQINESVKKALSDNLNHKQALLDIANATGNNEEQLQAQQEYLEAQRQQELNSKELTEQQRIDIERKYDAISQSIDRQSAEAKIAVASGLVGQLADIAGQNTAAGKAFAVAQAGINTYLGITKALATYAPPLGFVAAASVGLQGLLQVQKIASTPIKGFADSGITLSGQLIGANDGLRIKRSNGDNLLATVKTGEVILNQRHQAMLGGSGTFRAIGVPGFADGGISPGFSQLSLRGNDNVFSQVNDLINATNTRIDRIKVVNVESESTETQQRVRNIEARATA